MFAERNQGSGLSGRGDGRPEGTAGLAAGDLRDQLSAWWSALLLRFQIDHVIAEQHGGVTASNNLALACPRCNTHKGPNIAGIDEETGRIVRLYNPRKDRWDEHFRWNGPELLGLTTIGRATIAVLDINEPSAIDLRSELIKERLSY